MSRKSLREEDGLRTGYDSTSGSVDEQVVATTTMPPVIQHFPTSDLVRQPLALRQHHRHSYIQAIGTPESYQYQRVNLNQAHMSFDGYNNFDFEDEVNSDAFTSSLDQAKAGGGIFEPPVRTYSPWTPRGAVLFAQDKIKPGSMKGSVFNMIIATVGGGMLSLPYGMRMCGLAPGMLFLVMAGWVSYHTNDFLLVASSHLPRGVKPTHLTLSKACSPKWGKYLATFTQAMLLIQMFGGAISYNVAFGGLLDLCWEVIVPKNKSPADGVNVYPWVIILLSWLIIYPLSLLRSMSALRFTSLLGFACGTYLSLVLFANYFALCNSSELSPQKTCFWTDGFYLRPKDVFNFETFGGFVQNMLYAYPYFAFSFTNQQYSLPIYVELAKQSREAMQKVVSYSHWIIFIQYTLSTFFPFLSFLDGTCGNILLNNFHKRADVVIAAIAISLSMVLTQPITVFAWRMNFAEITYKVKQLPQKEHVIITTLFVLAATIVSLMVTDIAVVFGVLGATTYPTIGFILPAVYLWNIVPSGRHTWRKRMAMFQAAVVAMLSLGSLSVQLYSMSGHNKHLGDCHNVQTIKASSLF